MKMICNGTCIGCLYPAVNGRLYAISVWGYCFIYRMGTPRPDNEIKQIHSSHLFYVHAYTASTEDEKRAPFFMDAIMKSQFLSLYCMVLADGIIDARELETLYRIGTEQYGLTQEEITATVRDAGTSFIMPTELSDKIRFLYNMAQIAYADGEIDNTEIDLMKRYIRKMNFAEENINAIADYMFDSVKEGKSINSILMHITA